MFFSHKRDTLIVLRYIENGSDVFGNKAENGCLVSAVNRNRYEQQISLSDRHFAAGKSAEILRFRHFRNGQGLGKATGKG